MNRAEQTRLEKAELNLRNSLGRDAQVAIRELIEAMIEAIEKKSIRQ